MAIKVLQILCEAYETRLFDYANLTKCLKQQAAYWEKVCDAIECRMIDCWVRCVLVQLIRLIV